MSERHNQKAKEIFKTIRYTSLATVTPDGKPWNSPVAYEVDSDYNIYWFSDIENQHSKNVRENPYAYLVIFDTNAPEGTGEGIYIEAEVEEISNREEINNIRNAKKKTIADDASEFLGDSVRRCYKATPKRMWMNDVEVKSGKFIRDYKVELNL